MPEPCVLAVGKFECFHLGHKELVGEMMHLARRKLPACHCEKRSGECCVAEVVQQKPLLSNGPGLLCDVASALVMFEPHPYRVLAAPDYKPLFTNCEREYLACELGADYLLEYPFDQKFAAMQPEDFCRILFEDLRAQAVVVGEGYRFGHKRTGTVNTLRQMAVEYGSQVHVVAPHRANSVSSETGSSKTSTSTIRELLLANKFSEAEGLLGYSFFMMGTVSHGRKLGRTIGFPTINLYPSWEKFLPVDGVYATRVFIDGRIYNSITNIGLCPTVESAGASRSVETHLFDFTGGELYGKRVRVEFLRFIRPERKFESLDALKSQIVIDCKHINTQLIQKP